MGKKRKMPWAGIFAWLWLLSWFAAIWSEGARWQLFFSGLLFFLISVMFVQDKRKKEKSDKNV